MSEATNYWIDSEEMYRLAVLLQQLTNEMSSIRAQLVIADGIVSPGELSRAGAPWAAHRAESDIFQAEICTLEVELAARASTIALMTAADVYGIVEGGLKGIGDLLGREIATVL
jgi:hypothetical protein